MIGKILSKDTLIFRIHVGEAENDEEGQFEMSYSSAGNPIVRSIKTGKWFIISWEEILMLAIEAGVAQE